jgi:uncharacterized protein (DUF433 family)
MKTKKRSTDIYRGRDPRDMPAYTIGEAAHYLRIPTPTFRSWVVGRNYPIKGGDRFFSPVISLPNREKRLLSFTNLVEAHVLDAIRGQHNVSLSKVRQAVSFLQKNFATRHPLADQRMETNGWDLFVRKFGQLINISQDGQFAMRELLDAHLQRIDRDSAGLAIRLYPFTRKKESIEPRYVLIDPYIAFGRPVLTGTGIPTAVIADRYKAGESIDELANDYDQERSRIEEAIRCELAEAA